MLDPIDLLTSQGPRINMGLHLERPLKKADAALWMPMKGTVAK
jgi:hypothetical protein